MPDPKDQKSDPQGGAGDSPKDGDVKGGSPASGKQDDKKGDGGKGAKEPQNITPEILTGVLNSRDRTWNQKLGEISKGQEGLLTQLEGFKETLAKLSKGPEKEDDKKTSKEDSQIAELRRTVANLEKQVKSESDARVAAEKEGRSFKFKTAVIDELTKQGCRKPDRAFRMIKDDLKTDEQVSRIFAKVDGDFGNEELELANYIKRVVKEEQLPELFEGTMRPGSPADGDSGGGGGYDYVHGEITNEQWLNEHDKIEKAYSEDRVKGFKRPEK